MAIVASRGAGCLLGKLPIEPRSASIGPRCHPDQVSRAVRRLAAFHREANGPFHAHKRVRRADDDATGRGVVLQRDLVADFEWRHHVTANPNTDVMSRATNRCPALVTPLPVGATVTPQPR